MLNFLQSQFLFYVAIAIILFVPGYFLLLAAWGRQRVFFNLEKLILAFGLSIVSVNFLLIFIGRIGIRISALSVILLVTLFCAVCFGIYKRRYANKNSTSSFSTETADQDDKSFSKNQTILIILILFLTIFVKTIYLSDTIFPTATDMGHHMYWSKLIAETGQLPVYEERDIIEVDGNYQVSEPRPIADFIIGEHLIFAAINLLSGIDFISYFPALILFLINIFGILALFILALKLFQARAEGKNIAIFALFLAGPLYAISSSQAKFISGGVIGNTLGNFLIPFALYFFLRAFQEKNSSFLTAAIFGATGIFYSHHLSGFILLYILFFIALIFFALNIKNIREHVHEWKKIIFAPSILATIAFGILFTAIVYTPSYLKINAVETAIGAPSKATRAGLTFGQLTFTAGEARMALGVAGLFLLFLLRSRKTYSSALLGGWAIALFLMSFKPDWLYLNIPSGRIANYIAFPLAILGSFAFIWIFSQIGENGKKIHLNAKMAFALFLLAISFAAFSGSYDNAQSLSAKNNFSEATQTFHASKYLAEKTDRQKDVILKDHNYLTADAWMKLFYMNGYNYPFSRGFFKRYEDETKKREMCTMWMISSPNSAEGQKCFSGTNTNFIVVNTSFDGPQFEKIGGFSAIYASDEVAVYYRNF